MIFFSQICYDLVLAQKLGFANYILHICEVGVGSTKVPGWWTTKSEEPDTQPESWLLQRTALFSKKRGQTTG